MIIRSGRFGSPGTARADRGSGSVVMLAVMMMVMVLGIASLIIGGYLLAAHRVRAAADLAALAAGRSWAEGGDACRAATTNAEANGVSLNQCRALGDRSDFVIAVRVSLAIRPFWAGLPDEVEAEAFAGPVLLDTG